MTLEDFEHNAQTLSFLTEGEVTGWKKDRSVKRTAFYRYCSATESSHSMKTAVVCTILELPLCFPLSLNSPNFEKFTRNRPLIILLTTRPITVMHWYPPAVVHFSCVARIQSFSCESYRRVIAAVLTLTRSAPQKHWKPTVHRGKQQHRERFNYCSTKNPFLAAHLREY